MGHIREVQQTWDRQSGSFYRAKRAVTKQFVRGPIPLDWLMVAAQLPGCALAVGVALWHLAGLRSSREDLPLSTERLRPFGVSRHSKDRALRALVHAGLVTVQRKAGRSPRVTLLRAPDA